MAREVINNGETGAVVRDKINANFSEIYTATDNLDSRVDGADADIATLQAATQTSVLVELLHPQILKRNLGC
jgi:hypothetical protein